MLIPLPAAAVGLASGAFLLQRQPALLSTPLLVLILCIACGVLLMACRLQTALPRLVTGLLAGMLFGFAWAGLAAHQVLSEEFDKALEGEVIVVEGVIDSLPQPVASGVQFHFRVMQAYRDEAVLQGMPTHIALAWYARRQTPARPLPEIHAGQRWRLHVRLEKPNGTANPSGFDYEAWLLAQGLRATGYVVDTTPGANQLLAQSHGGFTEWLASRREAIRERIYQALDGRPYAGVIAALVIGDQRAIAQSDWEIFNRTGTGHLMSISGLHITMISGLVASVMHYLWCHSLFVRRWLRSPLPLRMPAQKVAALSGAIAALAYVALSGFSIPAQRTLWMILVVALALWLGRLSSVMYVLGAALVAVILMDPWAVMWPGFWLSFGAVAILMYGSTGRVADRHGANRTVKNHSTDNGSEHATAARVRWRETLVGAARAQYIITIGLVPLGVLLFGQVSLVGPLANALAIPVISLAVTPLSLIGTVLPSPLGNVFLHLADALTSLLAGVLGWLSSLPWAVWITPVPSPWMFALALAGTLWLLAPRGWPVRWIGLAGWVPLLVNVPAYPAENELWVTALDVGQGTALLIETRRHRMLYDTGPGMPGASAGSSDAGSRVIVPYLQARGIRQLDTVVISHADLDHSGGALSIFNRIRASRLMTSMEENHPVAKEAAKQDMAFTQCAAGQEWHWDGVHFEVLHPSLESYEDPDWKPNARSCVLRISLREHVILLAGDIEQAQEAALVDEMPEKLPATVLLAPHHGSNTSSTAAFLEVVRPKIGLFQVGYRNRYHHPHDQVMKRYQAMDVLAVRSDEAGAVTMRFSDNMSVEEFRRVHARYWHGR